MAIDNNYGAGGAKLVIDYLPFLKKIVYNKNNVKQKLINETVRKIQDGTINKETGKALLGGDWQKVSGQLKQERLGRTATAKVATPSKLVQGVQDEVSKVPVESQVLKTKSAEEITQKADIQPKTSSNLAYKETPKIANAIEQTAKQVKEPPSTVRKVINSLSEVKTKVIEYVQNEQERVRKLVDRKDVKVDDISDPYLKATLYPGRVAEKVNQGKQEAEAIIKDSKKVADEFKSDLATVRKEVNDYLYFRHAPERNAALGEKAAGITTEEAEAGLKVLEESPRGAKIKELADRASKLNEQTLDMLKNAGVITEELYNTLRAKYKNHVPLNRLFEETDDIGSVLSGKGFNVRSTGIKAAKGSEREVDDILGNILINYEQAVLDTGADASVVFIHRNPEDAWINGVVKRAIDPENGRVVPLDVFLAMSEYLGFPEWLKDITNEILIYEGHATSSPTASETSLRALFPKVVSFVSEDRSVRPLFLCYK